MSRVCTGIDAAEALAKVDSILRALAFRSVQGRDTGEDIWQEARIRFVQSLDRYEPARCSLGTWAHIQAWGAIRHYKRDKEQLIRRPAASWERGETENLCSESIDDEYFEERNFAYDDRAGIDDALRVELLLARLTRAQREVVELRLRGFSDAEIARKLGVPCSTVRVRKQASRSRLLRLLDFEARERVA